MIKYEDYEIQLETIPEGVRCRVFKDGISLGIFEIKAHLNEPYWDEGVDEYMGWYTGLHINDWQDFQEEHGVSFYDRGIIDPHKALNYLTEHFDNYIKQQNERYENYKFPYSETI